MKKIWANWLSFTYNIGHLRGDKIFMYFQIESDLREKIWKFSHFNNKIKFKVRNL